MRPLCLSLKQLLFLVEVDAGWEVDEQSHPEILNGGGAAGIGVSNIPARGSRNETIHLVGLILILDLADSLLLIQLGLRHCVDYLNLVLSFAVGEQESPKYRILLLEKDAY